ncbi:hypothetical protein Nepgr_008334 [Nepenthes gracilis]|uniref:Dof zinc finger protein n=1 Tax=Nepenthes gracilis TaxID=150966 RepID=A0AAD3XJ64_NEPGR|nr:hypothetical protein Nepgr_008334 [Nepenthes gracilis]
MMSPDKLQVANMVTKKETHQSSGGDGGRKTSPSRRPPDQQPLKCPRCDSPNTKFCYYNNCSLTQPRHFCKTCRRYWTKGGALRNVPIGGGCRKNKKMKPSSSTSSSSLADDHHYKDLAFGGHKFFHGLPPAMDFQLGSLSLPRAGFFNQFSPFWDINGGPELGSSSCTSFLGFSSTAATLKQGESSGFRGSIQEMGLMNVNGNLASSIESLSSINQELHWKLQQQRFAMLLGIGGGGEDNNNYQKQTVSGIEKPPQPILFHDLEMSNSRKNGAAEWFFDSTFTQNPTYNGSNNNENSTTRSFNNGAHHAWTHDLHQFTGLP